ncbi:MAG TPA: hypothetical protein VF644_10600 [Pyrinomonadaceae bacterium]
MENNQKRDLTHPVWNVYDDYRTALLNVKIQKAELKRLRKINFFIEIPLAITASATITGLWIWGTAYGGYIWKILGLISAFLAVLKPLLKFPEKIQQRGEMLADYSSIEYELEKIKTLISQEREYSKKLKEQYLKTIDKKQQIKAKHTGIKYLEINPEIKRLCTEEVKKEHPASSFYIPED